MQVVIVSLDKIIVKQLQNAPALKNKNIDNLTISMVIHNKPSGVNNNNTGVVINNNNKPFCFHYTTRRPS